MNKLVATVIFTTWIFGKVQGQQIYFKPYIRYHQSIATQNAPQYFILLIPVPLGTNFSSNIPVSSAINKFSLSSGIKYGVCLGYQFNNIIGIETGIDYYKTNKTIQADAGIFNPPGTTHWKYQSIQASPSFTFRKTTKKSFLTGKAGIIIGLAWLQNSIALKDYAYKTYRLNKNVSLGYTLGLEYDYNFKPHFLFVVECGFDYSSYTPKKAKLTAIDGLNGNSVQNQNESTREINYVNQIRNLSVRYDYYSSGYVFDQNKPEIRLKDAVRLSSIYFGIGVKYNFWKDEKK